MTQLAGYRVRYYVCTCNMWWLIIYFYLFIVVIGFDGFCVDNMENESVLWRLGSVCTHNGLWWITHTLSPSLSPPPSLSLSLSFSPYQHYQTDHTHQLTSVYHNLGMLVTGSKDKSARLHTMSQPHSCLKTIDHFQDVTDVRKALRIHKGLG